MCGTRSSGLENRPGRMVEVEEAEEAEEESSVSGDEGTSPRRASYPRVSSSSASSNISRLGGGAFRGIGGSRGNLANFALRNSRWKSLMADAARNLRGTEVLIHHQQGSSSRDLEQIN